MMTKKQDVFRCPWLSSKHTSYIYYATILYPLILVCGRSSLNQQSIAAMMIDDPLFSAAERVQKQNMRSVSEEDLRSLSVNDSSR